VDLQWIVFSLLAAALAIAIFIATVGAPRAPQTPQGLPLTSSAAPAHKDNRVGEVAGAVGIDLKVVVGSVLTVMGAILSWVYQSGSNRLGAVDLFGCEISAICRVMIVVDFARKSVKWAEQDSAEMSGKFTSEEQYTPVYDNMLSTLQPLEVDVVTSVTEFYTYRKTLVDYLKRIAVEEMPSRRSELLTMMVYMQLLMYESGRQAVERLVEFEPNRDESIINILCSELTVFAFLKKIFCQDKHDYHGGRLLLRESIYRQVVPAAYYRAINAGDHKNWLKAQTTATEMKRRYEEVLGGFPDTAAYKPGFPG
jgi:hypothetical protein